jgi:hypothetical protein
MDECRNRVIGIMADPFQAMFMRCVIRIDLSDEGAKLGAGVQQFNTRVLGWFRSLEPVEP